MSGVVAARTDKQVSLAEAVRRYVQPGRTVYFGNFGSQLFCIGHELIRQKVTGVHAVISSGGLLMDQLLGSGVLASATFGHCWSPVGPNPAWNFRRLVESGEDRIPLHEMSLGMLTAALTAGAWDVPFMPVPGLPGTGYRDEDWSGGYLSTVTSEFGTTDVVAAICPAVAFVHVDRADADGNGVVNGPLGEVLLAAQASEHVVVVAEELVPGDELSDITVPGLLVRAVVEQPSAVAPDGAIGRYDRDVSAYEAYTSLAATPEGFATWLAGIVADGAAS